MERVDEINLAMSVIQRICEDAEIGLIAKELNGTIGVVIQDARNGKEYVVKRIGSQ